MSYYDTIMIQLWYYYDTIMILLWYYYDTIMILLWYYYDTSMMILTTNVGQGAPTFRSKPFHTKTGTPYISIVARAIVYAFRHVFPLMSQKG